MTDVVILWHMHQPRYVHPTTGRAVLPWVRLHAASGYLDMARALERRPGARVTVNFVPSLVEQIEMMLAGGRDLLEEIAEKPAAELDEGERLQVLARSFSVRLDRVLDPRPRYAELWAKRGERIELLAEQARRFTAAEIRDIECLFLLGWLGFAAREDDPEIDVLDAKGRDYTEEDKRYLLYVVRRAAGMVLPAWRALAERGQVELATSPFYHPIVPLIIDSDVARRARPDDALPPRFAHPEDAEAQIRRAREHHRKTFGADPVGMWPPEGSLSPEAVSLYRECGVSWLCGDEAVLARSLESKDQPGAASRVWRWDGVDLLFRNRELSDRIGFRYADVPTAAAAADLIDGARGQGDGIVGLFLDGENAWESYPRRGADFLDAVYARLERGGDVASRTVSEAVGRRGPGKPLARLHSGSWIDASFRIWIGDPVKNRAWAELGRTRDGVGNGSPRALELILAAEGSDWFWWYGEPFSSAEDALFDELFRAHLREAWRAIGKEPPPSLDEAIGGPPMPARAAVPTAWIRPQIDGLGRRFYEWSGAALHQVGRGGAMADSGHPIDRLWVGFSEDALYLRLDPHKSDRARVVRSRVRLRLLTRSAERSIAIILGEDGGGEELRALGGRAAAVEVVEIMIPLRAIDAKPRDTLRLWMTLEEGGQTFARVPRDGALTVVVPWPGWEADNWTV